MTFSLVQESQDWSTPYRIAYTNTFGKPPWFDHVAAEYAACRETVGISDYSSFTKIDLWVSFNCFSQNDTQRQIYLVFSRKAMK